MRNESDVIVHESSMFRLKKPDVSSSPKMQAHPDASVIWLEVMPPLFWCAFRRVPSCEVRTRPIERNLFHLVSEPHNISWPCPSLSCPRRAISKLLCNPQSE